MKDFILLIIATILIMLLGIIGIPYTAIYYLNNEKSKKRSYCYRLAFGLDCFACISFGEFFEVILCKTRGLSSFGSNTSISACIGESIVLNNFKENYNWFTKLLDFLFKEPNHCINAYRTEIL